jgi:hypothetical protein
MESVAQGLSFRYLLPDSHTHFSVPQTSNSASHVAEPTKIFCQLKELQ